MFYICLLLTIVRINNMFYRDFILFTFVKFTDINNFCMSFWVIKNPFDKSSTLLLLRILFKSRTSFYTMLFKI